GATSQDAMDTGLVLQLRDALALIEADLATLAETLSRQALLHADTPLVGRTWLQHATPVTLGMKLAGILGAVTRHRQRLQELRPRLLVLQFGGASGSLAALGSKALPVAEGLAAQLKLTLPEQPWHTQRDRLVEFASVLGLIAGSLGKLGRDVSLLMQTEAGEVFEPSAPGKGGSSTMPHKRNPVGCVAAIAAATRVPGLLSTLFTAMPQPHERAAGQWHAEWDTVPEIVRLCAGSLAQVSVVVQGLQLDRARMQAHLDSHGGLLYAEAVTVTLAGTLGKAAAHALVEQAARRALDQSRHLHEVLQQMPEVTAHLSPAQLQALFAADSWRGMADTWIDRVLAQR
ncbi:MAG TPA: 3-carboxy-cis,cis-muconate cycloisomerase, partial [Stenotrophomonas sp.]|nr:3-carboxy-cis,cis-muconate cycloisomerase [Stenotrophomonas sp.]